MPLYQHWPVRPTNMKIHVGMIHARKTATVTAHDQVGQGPLDSPARLLDIMIVTDIPQRDIGHDHGVVDIAPFRS